MKTTDDQLVTIINQSKTTRNINKLLPARSKNPDVINMISTIKERTDFLPPDADIRQRLWYIEHNATTPPICACCGINYVQWDYTNQRFRDYCSPKCVGNSDDVKQQKRQTCLNTIGVDYPAQSSAVRDKYKATMFEKYGAPYVNQPPLMISGAYNGLSPDQLSDMTHNQQLSTFDIAERIGVSQATVSRYMARQGIPPRQATISSFQRTIINAIKQHYAGEVLINDRSIIKPQELDIVLPGLRLAFECDGLFWHGELYGRKPRNYHIDKTTAAANAGFRLIHIFESDVRYHMSATLSRIRSLVGANDRIYARKCEIVQVPTDTARSFFNDNHVQGFVGSPIVHGLVYNNELVACMGWAKPRFNKHYDMELTRFCTKAGYTVVGGASKLFTHMIRTSGHTRFISYCDKRWGTGDVYKQLGFVHKYDTKPNYWYVSNGNILSRMQFQKHKLISVLDDFDPLLSEWENMKLNGYDRIWDCGNGVWTCDATNLQM